MADPDVRFSTIRGALSVGTAAGVRSLASRATAADGVAPLSEHPLLHLGDTAGEPTAADPAVAHVLALDDGDLVGYAQIDLGSETSASAELVVAPGARRRGIGTALLSRLGTLAADPPRRLTVWAHGNLLAARALAAGAGLAAVRELWQMRLDLAVRPAADRAGFTVGLPAGAAVRAFVPGQDEDAWLRLNARAFAHHPEQGRMTLGDLVAREREPWFDPAGLLLAERGGDLVAAVWTKVHALDEGAGPIGELYVVGVDPDAQGIGLGTAMTRLGVDHLESAGLPTVVLYTEADNTAAVRTYTRAGFHRSSVDVMFGFDMVGLDPASARRSGTIGR